jgi:hypothetical protein
MVQAPRNENQKPGGDYENSSSWQFNIENKSIYLKMNQYPDSSVPKDSGTESHRFTATFSKKDPTTPESSYRASKFLKGSSKESGGVAYSGVHLAPTPGHGPPSHAAAFLSPSSNLSIHGSRHLQSEVVDRQKHQGVIPSVITVTEADKGSVNRSFYSEGGPIFEVNSRGNDSKAKRVRMKLIESILDDRGVDKVSKSDSEEDGNRAQMTLAGGLGMDSGYGPERVTGAFGGGKIHSIPTTDLFGVKSPGAPVSNDIAQNNFKTAIFEDSRENLASAEFPSNKLPDEGSKKLMDDDGGQPPVKGSSLSSPMKRRLYGGDALKVQVPKPSVTFQTPDAQKELDAVSQNTKLLDPNVGRRKSVHFAKQFG